MASSMSTVPRRLCRSLLTNPNWKTAHYTTTSVFSNRSSFSTLSDKETEDDDSVPDSPTESSAELQSPVAEAQGPRPGKVVFDRPLENGLDVGVYKAILLGQVGQKPLQKMLKSGIKVVLFSVGTGGARNNRRPFDDENPKEYANRGFVQWHRVSVYPQRLGDLVMKEATPGSNVYLEGNLETKIFTDPMTGLVRRVREVAIRHNGRIIFLGQGADSRDAAQGLKNVGYF